MFVGFPCIIHVTLYDVIASWDYMLIFQVKDLSQTHEYYVQQNLPAFVFTLYVHESYLYQL